MTIRWLSNDYLMTIQWLSGDYLMTIQWLSWTFDLFFLMIIDLKRSIHRRWLFKSGATFNLRWSCLANWLNFLWRTAESRELQIIIIYSCANFQTVSPKLLTADENCWQTVWRCQDIAIYWGGDNYRGFFFTGLLKLVSKGVLGLKYYGFPRKLVPANHPFSFCELISW